MISSFLPLRCRTDKGGAEVTMYHSCCPPLGWGRHRRVGSTGCNYLRHQIKPENHCRAGGIFTNSNLEIPTRLIQSTCLFRFQNWNREGRNYEIRHVLCRSVPRTPQLPQLFLDVTSSPTPNPGNQCLTLTAVLSYHYIGWAIRGYPISPGALGNSPTRPT